MDGNNVVRLLGINRSGTEFQCVNGVGFADGPTDAASVTAMKAWHINTVRVPLNEDCWLGIHGAPAQYSGSAYQTAIAQWVSTLRQGGLYVIVDLHWNNGTGALAKGQQNMADEVNSPAFWASVASTFKNDLGVVFDLYNEPHDIPWTCWRDGGCATPGWTVAGMNELITSVRNAGANNVVMAGGLSWSGDLSQWLAYKPTDSTGNLAASFHSYNFSNCHDMACWTSQLAPVAAQVPIITGEMGENDCDMGGAFSAPGPDYIKGLMSWADGAGVSYLGWAWNPDFMHCTGPSLVSAWDGSATTSPFGSDFKSHLCTLAGTSC
jgi:aryl-phospho-beta-D-glucosidase BglC (GH1 family)